MGEDTRETGKFPSCEQRSSYGGQDLAGRLDIACCTSVQNNVVEDATRMLGGRHGLGPVAVGAERRSHAHKHAPTDQLAATLV